MFSEMDRRESLFTGPRTLKYKAASLELTEEVEENAKIVVIPPSLKASGDETDIFT